MKKKIPILLKSINQCVFEPSDDGIHLPDICKKCNENKSVHHLINESHSVENGETHMSNKKFILIALKLLKYDEMVKIALKKEKENKRNKL